MWAPWINNIIIIIIIIIIILLPEAQAQLYPLFLNRYFGKSCVFINKKWVQQKSINEKFWGNSMIYDRGVIPSLTAHARSKSFWSH